MIRDRLKAAQIAAMKGGDKEQLAAVRLILAAVKNRDIDARTGAGGGDDDALLTDVLLKMAKQRRESIEMYDRGGRAELAAQERGELAVIESFLPQMMNADEVAKAVASIVAEIGATGPKDMGRVMAEVKARHAGKIDMSGVSSIVKAALG
jgi:uncharacterized protein YqeY